MECLIPQAAPVAMLILGLYFGGVIGIIIGIWRGQRLRRKLQARIYELQDELYHAGGDWSRP